MIDRYESYMADAPTPPPARVLVVEDDLVAARSLRYLLEHYGYRVHVANNVRQAIDLLDQEPQIILLDLSLPDGDGTQVMQAIKARRMTSCVAVVTAVIDHDRLREVRMFDPQFLLPKPLDFLSLLGQLRGSAA